MTTTTNLTCTCASRYVRDGDHESDCDLWLIDEFWAGFLAWDWNEEILYRTDMYPADHVPDNGEYEWVDDYLSQKDEQARVDENLRDRDIALTTDMFIDRMISKYPEDTNVTWAKNDDGFWVATEPDGTQAVWPDAGNSNYTATTPAATPGVYDWDTWATDRHTMTPITFPDGTTVHGTSSSKQYDRPTPDFGLYLDSAWKPDGLAIMLPWRDFGLPSVSFGFADYAIKEAFSWASAGAIVEVGCIGGHGRTGTVLACMAILSDAALTPEEAVLYVKEVYCDHAIETAEQEWYIARFAASERGEPEPEKPAHKPVVRVVNAGTATPNLPTYQGGGASTHSMNTPDPAKPGRQGKARRSKRGGRRTQQHRNRMSQGSRR